MRFRTFRILLNLAIVVGMLLPTAVIAPARAATPPARASRPALPSTGLYRTRVTIDSPAPWMRIEELGIIILERGDDSALVLVDAAQLEELARLGLRPHDTNELGLLVSAQGPRREWLHKSLQPLLEKGAAWYGLYEQSQGLTLGAQSVDAAQMETAHAELQGALAALTPEQTAGVSSSSSVDDDGDGLTNTEELWWCTDPNDVNTDDDANGYTDGQEVNALLDRTLSRTERWNYGPPFGPPAAWPDFNGQDGDPNTPACNDGDYDTIPDYAEAYVVGTRVGTGDSENTDGDKFDDGQEFFGTTYCPGGTASCGWGSYPRPQDYSFITSGMPSWIRPPGDSPFIAAYPVIEFLVDPNTIVVTTKEIRTIEETITQGTEISTGFATTEGNSTSVGTVDTNTHNTWQEHSSTEGGIAPASVGTSSLRFGAGEIDEPVYQVKLNQSSGQRQIVLQPSLILADGQYVYGPNVGDFRTDDFLRSIDSPLLEYADIIHDKASYYSINPRVLLTIIEMGTGKVAGRNEPVYQLDASTENAEELSNWLESLASNLDRFFYTYLYGENVESPIVTTNDMEDIKLQEGTNAASIALIKVLGPNMSANKLEAFSSPTHEDGFTQLYSRLFPESNALDNSNQITTDTPPPSDFKLPFPAGDEWFFSGGPHPAYGSDYCNSGVPYSSVDFAPGVAKCTIPTDRFITSPAKGTVTDVSCGGCLVKLSHQSGWGSYFYHVANPSVSVNQEVEKNQKLGNPSQMPSCGGTCGSCGGSATGVHEHYSLMLNGAFQPIDGKLNFEGWTVYETGCYDGYLQKGEKRIYDSSGEINDPSGKIKSEKQQPPSINACFDLSIESSVAVPSATLATEQRKTSWFEQLGKRIKSWFWNDSGGAQNLVVAMSASTSTTGVSSSPRNFSDFKSEGQCGGSPQPGSSSVYGAGGGGSGLAYQDDGSGGFTSLRVWSETTTSGEGWSTSHSELRTETQYSEITRSETNTLVSSEAWSTATTTDPTDAGQLTFNYNLHNAGSDYAVNIVGMKINVLIGDLPVITWNAPDANDIGPAESKGPFEGGPIILTLEQLAAIDNGEPIRIVLADYDYDDNLYDANAWARSVLFHVDDGSEDGDELSDTYLITTNLIQNETYQDTLARYFPIETFQGEPDDPRNGTITSITTPEYDASGEITHWVAHSVTEHAWWELAISQGGETNGVAHFKDMPAKSKTDVYLRYVIDSDGDGFSDKAELAANSDPNNPEIHPRPSMIAAKYTDENGSTASVQLSLQNNGNYDASSVEVWAVALDDSITIDDNLIGGGGRVRANRRVVLGARVGKPNLDNWTTSTSKPYPGGQFEGTSPKTYKFRADGSGNVSVTSGLTVSWSDDGEQTWHAMDVGDTYSVNTEMPVSDGVVIAFTDGYISLGETFTFETALPIDTFSYTINRTPYTLPLIIVSYNDAQGNHKFVSDVEVERIQDDLTPYLWEMRYGFKVDVMSDVPYSLGANTSYIVFNNPADATVYEAQVDVEFASEDGTVVATYILTGLTLLPGPNVFQLDWSTDDFSPVYDANTAYYVLAFVKDRQGTIFENTVKALDQLGKDALPEALVPDTLWDFGTARQGTFLRRTFAVSNVGEHELMTYVEASSGLGISLEGTRYLAAGDVTFYDVWVKTSELAEGPYSGTVTIRTNDPEHPTETITIQGEIAAATPATPVGNEQRPLDWDAYIEGSHNQGDWVEFTHTLGPDPQTLHPVKVYSADYTTFWGVGKYATDFGQGTAPGDMFGDGRDGTMPSSGNLDNNNGVGIGSVSGSAGSSSVSVTDRHAVWRIEPGDVVLLHQTQGSGAGNWELNKAVSDFSGSGTFMLEETLDYTYSSSSGNYAQIMRVPQYSTCNVTGTVTPLAAWNGTWGGIFAVMCNGSMSISGHISTDGMGFRNSGAGGIADRNPGGLTSGQQGEGINGPGSINTSANGNGGGGGSTPGDGSGGGGGGGHATAGTKGANGQATGGNGGYPSGDSILSNMTYGGQGGGAGGENNGDYNGGRGGNGGGIIVLFVKTIDTNGSISSNGHNGGNAIVGSSPNVDGAGGGGGGAGGAIFVSSETLDLGTSRLTVHGGSGGNHLPSTGSAGNGGAGSVGRIRIEYCESMSGSTNPAASTAKIDCYITEQMESSPYTTTSLNLPKDTAEVRRYQVQYGRRFVFSGVSEQINTLRLPASMLDSATLDALISDAGSGTFTFKLDIGDDGSWDWEVSQNVDDHVSLTSPDLSAAFNQYWSANGAALSGDMDVPVRVSVSKGAQVLLTNLRITPAGGKTRYVRLDARSYDGVSLTFTVSDGSGPLSVAADVGDDGSVDWTWNGDPAYPVQLTTDDLASAFNAYLSGQSGEVDVPVRFYLTPLATLSLDDVHAQPVGQADVRPSDLQADQNSPTEGAVVTLSVTVHNDGDRESGPLTVSFYATPPDGYGEVYVGATLINDVPASGAVTASIQWDTLGFTGDNALRVVVDPYDHIAESGEDNNDTTGSITILTRPDLNVSEIAFSDDEPVDGETITVQMSLHNDGQTAANGVGLALYDEDPNGVQTLVCTLNPDVSGETVITQTCSWTPASPGPHRLYTNVDEGNAVNEFDEDNNQTWQDIYVGFAGPLLLDSGGDASADPSYDAARGYGYLNGIVQNVCGDASDETYRQGEGSDTTVDYQFDHLLPGHYYHLDMTFYLCSGTRNQRVLVDDYEVVSQFTVNAQVQRISVLLDPALYTDHSIKVSVEKTGLPAPMINQINLIDIRYCYRDSGGADEVNYAQATDGCGWIEGDYADSGNGVLPYQTVRYNNYPGNVGYQLDMTPGQEYMVNFTFFDGYGTGQVQDIELDGATVLSGVTLTSTPQYLSVEIPASMYQDDGSVVVTIKDPVSQTPAIAEISLEQKTIPGDRVDTTLTNNGNDITLAWPDNASFCTYEIYTSASPDVLPSPTNLLATVSDGSNVFTHTGAGSDPDNHYYLIRQVDCEGATYMHMNETGVFKFTLEPGS